MFGAVLALFLFGSLVAFVSSRRLGTFGQVLLAGYAARIFVSLFVRDLPLFAHGTGGDFGHYEIIAQWVSELWQRDFHYATQADFPEMGPTSLPPNVFALIFTLNGSPTPLGATSIVAACATLTVYMLYELSIELGCSEIIASRIFSLMLFSPAFFMFTSDCYKEGFVLFFVMLALRSAFRLARTWSYTDAIYGMIATLGIFNVRFYLVLVTLGPLAVGLLGSGKSIFRTFVVSIGIVLVSLATFTYSPAVRDAADAAAIAFDVGTKQIDFTAQGSGIEFADQDDPFSQISLKILYTLFAPFPWQSGSIGFQIGKVESLLGYFFIYRSLISAKRLWTEDRITLFMFLVFIVPTTVMYAASIYNVGLIVRERMPIIMVFGLMATLGYRKAEVTVSEQTEEDAADPDAEATSIAEAA